MNIPKGWRFYSADASVLNRCSVLFIRDEDGKKKWHRLTDEEKETIDLYKCSTKETFEEAIKEVCDKASSDHSMETYSI